jgi:hypothetical protein
VFFFFFEEDDRKEELLQSTRVRIARKAEHCVGSLGESRSSNNMEERHCRRWLLDGKR